MEITNIKTERCLIRDFHAADIASFLSYRNDSEWMKYQAFKGLTESEYQQILLSKTPWQNGRQLAIIDRQQQLIGDLFLQKGNDYFWLGYTIAPNFAHQGYATEAVTAILQWLSKHNVSTVQAAVLPANTNSIRLLQKLDFHFVQTDNNEMIYRKRI